MFRFGKNKKDVVEEVKETQDNPEEKFNKLFNDSACRELSVAIGSDLIPFIEKIVDEIWNLRIKIKEKNGFIIPLVYIYDDENLQENEFVIKIRNNAVYNGFVIPNEEESVKEILENLEKVCAENIDSIFSMSILNKYIEQVNANNQWLMNDIRFFYTVSDIRYVFLYLLKHNCSINDVTFIFEKMCDFCSVDKYNFRNVKKVSEFVYNELFDNGYEQGFKKLNYPITHN